MKCQNTRLDRIKGFLLVELLVVMALSPIVFFSVYSSFSAGIRIWSTVSQKTPEEDVNIFYYKIQHDLENMRRYALVPFDGDKQEFLFISSIDARVELGGKRGIGQVRYFYDDTSKTLNREVKDFSQMYTDATGFTTVLLKEVTLFEMSYLFFNPTEKNPSWSESCTMDGANLPLAMQVSFSTAQNPAKHERVIFIPAGGSFK